MSPLAKETGQTLVPGYVVSDDPTVVQVGDAAVLKGCVCMKLIHPACCKVGLWMLYKQTNKCQQNLFSSDGCFVEIYIFMCSFVYAFRSDEAVNL